MLIRSCLARTTLNQHSRMLSLKFVLDGRETFRVRSRRFDIGPGEALLAPAGLDLEVELEAGRETTGLCLYIPDPEIGGVSMDSLPPLHLRMDSDFVREAREFESAVRRGRHDLSRVAEFSALFRATGQRRLQPILTLAERSDKLRPELRFALAQRLDRAHRFLLSNLHRRIDLDELAAVAAMSKFEFCRAFRVAFGRPPLTAHRIARLNRAASLLSRSDRTASEIAAELGFSEIANFSRAFRKQFGCPPGQYQSAQSRT